MTEPLSIAARLEAVEDDLRSVHAAFDGALVGLNDLTVSTLAANERIEQFMTAVSVMVARLTMIVDGMKH